MGLEEIILFAAFFAFCFYSKKKYNEKEQLVSKYRKAISIAKYFGETEIALFRFIEENMSERDCYWVLIEFNQRIHDIQSLEKHKKYYVVSQCHEERKELWQKEDLEVRSTLSLLPYHCPIFDAPIPFQKYESLVSEQIKKYYAEL